MLANLAAAIGISAALTYLVAWRFSRSARWQYGLRDILAATVVIALPLGLLLRIEHGYQVDRTYIKSLEMRHFTWDTQDVTPTWYQRPWLDLGLLNRDALAPANVVFFSWYSSGYANAEPDPDFNISQFFAAEVNAGRHLQLPLDCVELNGVDLTDDGLTALTEWAPDCRRLFLTGENAFTDRGVATLAQSWPRLTAFHAGSPQLTRKSLQTLLELHDLENINLEACSCEVTLADLQPLTELPKLRWLIVPKFLYRQISREQIERWNEQGLYVGCSTFLAEDLPETESP